MYNQLNHQNLISLCSKPIFILLILIELLLTTSLTVNAAENHYTLSLQQYAFNSNAGGQETWALRMAKNESWEISAFANEYLRTGKYPLVGATYDLRYKICGISCPIRSFAQVGGGFSSAGPMIELLWNITPLWLFRIDFATHIYVVPYRAIAWNYPFWLGLSIPF
ncbi:MAG: hypothetical protein R3B45_10120 [Bdellovibrionota bacterium]